MLTALQLSKKVLLETKVPMNAEEIWDYAKSKGYSENCNLKGKTPSKTLAAQMYIDINKGDSGFYKYSTRPSKFGLSELEEAYKNPLKDCEKVVKVDTVSTFHERDLHPLLIAFINSDPHFQAYGYTIYHEKSSKSRKNSEKWVHPDIVGVHYAFQDLSPVIRELAGKNGEGMTKLFSFEMKKEITLENVREYYFQAVSNSSWANEGYLVAPKISKEAMDRLNKLNASFGIGVIKLNVDDVYQSEIVIPSRENDILDLAIMDELVEINPDFKNFIKKINDSLKIDASITKDFDIVLDEDELKRHIELHHIC